jgi:hypothetical protein
MTPRQNSALLDELARCFVRAALRELHDSKEPVDGASVGTKEVKRVPLEPAAHEAPPR